MLFFNKSFEAGHKERVIGKVFVIKNIREISTLEFHLSRMLTLPCYILHGMAPDEYK